MIVLPANFPIRLIIAMILSCNLIACGGAGTVDIMGDDSSTFVGSGEIEQKQSSRYSVDVGYLVTRGSNSQLISTGVQVDGNRVSDGKVESDYTFQALTAHFEYTYFQRDRFRLTAAPALQLSHASVSATAEELNFSFDELYPGIGVRLGTSFEFSDRTRGVFETALYDQRASNVYTSSGIWLEHNLSNRLGLKFGYSTHSVNDGNDFANDGCNGLQEDPLDCDESGFSIRSTGLHLGIRLIQ